MPATTDRKVVWITVGALVVVLGLGWVVFNQRSCARWQQDVRTAYNTTMGDPGPDRRFQEAGIRMLAELEGEKPPLCSTPLVDVVR